ncbi:MAG: NFACT family protein [Bacilli bacterium]|nr:NFACT family protein [Bacilli bacterium]
MIELLLVINVSFDGLMFRRVTELLKEYLVGAKINKVNQVSTFDFVFLLYKDKKGKSMIVSTNPSSSYITYLYKNEKESMYPTHFMTQLRHHIENSEIIEVNQQGLDRVLKLSIRKRDELGDYQTKHLYIELTGKMTNIILCKNDETIIDALHRIGPNDLIKRIIMPGARYRLPPVHELKDPFIDAYDKQLSLCNQFFGFSKSLEKECLYRIENGESLIDILQEIKQSETMYLYSKDYHLIPLTHLQQEAKILPWDEGLETFYKSIQIQTKRIDKTKELLLIAKKEIKKYSNKIAKLEVELQKSENSEIYKEYGDILFTYCENLKAKLDKFEIEVDDVKYSIPLNKQFDVLYNANKYYTRYQKGKKGVQMINEQIEIAKNELEYFELLNIQINDANDTELQQIRAELASLGYLKLPQTRNKKKQEIKYPPLEFTSPTGIKISLGKNNYQNDYLTNKLAKYNEYFFHVKDYPGSHVIVHSTTLDEPTIRYAANLAAYYSKTRYSSTVPVNYTIVKNVKKIPGAKLGLVSIKNYKTIYIDPVPEKEFNK